VKNQGVGRSRPFLRRHRGAELLFDDLRFVRLGNADPVRDAKDVAIHGQARDAKRMAEHDVGRLSADARELDQFVHGGWDLAVMFVDDGCGHSNKRPRFRAEEAGGLNLRLEFVSRCARERTRIRIPLEQRRCDLIDALVGALRRQDRRNEQLVGVGVMEFGVGVGVLAAERLHDPPRVGGRFGRRGDAFARSIALGHPHILRFILVRRSAVGRR